MTFQRRLAQKLVEMWLEAICSVECFDEILKNTDKEIYLQLIDHLVNASEQIILMEFPHEEGNGTVETGG
jgi:hypothetical protein